MTTFAARTYGRPVASHYVVRQVDRADPEVVAALRAAGVATAHEAAGRIGLLGPAIRARQDGAAIAGSAITVSCHPGDNLMVHAAVEVCRPGDVLVVTTTPESTNGMFGELLATSCRAHGIAGLVIDAGVRDVADLTTMAFPVWAKAIHAQGTVKATAGSVNVPVVCAGAAIAPGDVVIGDVDGVVVVPKAMAADVAKAGADRLAKEEKSRARLKNGELGLDFYGLRAKLAELGVQYVDEGQN